jgi:hypothetical protein
MSVWDVLFFLFGLQHIFIVSISCLWSFSVFKTYTVVWVPFFIASIVCVPSIIFYLQNLLFQLNHSGTVPSLPCYYLLVISLVFY